MRNLTEEQELLLDSLRELAEREFPEKYLNELDKNGEYPYKIAAALYENGFTTLGIPEEYGGTPADNVTLCLVQEELGRLGVPYTAVMCALTIGDILQYGNEKQKKLAIDALAENQGVPPFCLGITEPQAGSDDNAIEATYVRKDGKIVINGHKTFISLAGQVPYMLAFAKNPECDNPKKAISVFMVPMNAEGVTVAHLEKIGMNCAPTYEVYLQDVTVEEEDLVGIEGAGFMILMKNFEAERLLAAAGALGWAEGAYEDAARYANQRVQFKQPIGGFQLIQKRITDMAVKIENMRNLIYSSAEDLDSGVSAQISSAACKYYCGIAAGEVIDSAMQVLGGIGYSRDHRISRMWRDVRSIRIGGGTDEIMVHILGRAILKNYR